LEKYDCEVKMARESDVFVDNGVRARMANDWGADLYFSIHINGHSNTSANGYEDYTHPAAPIRTREIQKAIHPLSARVWTNKDRANRGMKQANFQVLRQTRMSAVLVEHGFITNSKDAELLKGHTHRERLADAMEKGIVEAMGLQKGSEDVGEKGTPITGEPKATLAQARKWAQDRGAHERFIDVAKLYWIYGEATDIRPEVLYAQSAKETAFGRYSGVVTPDQNNWAGIKTRNPTGDKREDHESFFSPDDGVRAHFNHMGAYVGHDPIGTPHPRWQIARNTDWAGKVKHVEELGGKWAPNPEYGESIVKDYLDPLLATSPPDTCLDCERLMRKNNELAKKLEVKEYKINKAMKALKGE